MTKNRYSLLLGAMTDQQVSDRYVKEAWRLKTLNCWRLEGSHGSRPCGHPDTAMMNACKQELSRRGLVIPQVDL